MTIKIYCTIGLKKTLSLIFGGVILIGNSYCAVAGGVALGSTRVIYPIGNNQVSLAITNTDKKNIFLIQSWVSGIDGKKTADFVVTPPLFSISPEKENTLRIMYVGKGDLPQDRESIYYLNSKAIPGGTPPTPGQNTLQIATQTIIKLFMRPTNLPTKSIDAPNTLQCKINGSTLMIDNPSPYYISMVNLMVGNKKLQNTLVPPKSNAQVRIENIHHDGSMDFQTVNDYGASSHITKLKCSQQ